MFFFANKLFCNFLVATVLIPILVTIIPIAAIYIGIKGDLLKGESAFCYAARILCVFLCVTWGVLAYAYAKNFIIPFI